MDYISIDNFEGPLDLLLHLVKEANIDILDIKVEEITDKYLEYIKREEELNINIAASYLVMASELMYLKSKSLLPVVKKDDEEVEDEEITRENLINRLIEYKRYKEMTPVFKELEEERKKIYIASADFMTRNTVRRVEVAAPVLNEKLKERLDWMFETMMNDDEKGKRLTETGNYADRSLNDVKLNSQEIFYAMAYSNAEKIQKKEKIEK